MDAPCVLFSVENGPGKKEWKTVIRRARRLWRFGRLLRRSLLVYDLGCIGKRSDKSGGRLHGLGGAFCANPGSNASSEHDIAQTVPKLSSPPLASGKRLQF